MSLGVGELIVLGFVVVVVFSAARMGALGNALGRFVYAFRKASRGQGYIDGKARKVQGTRLDSEDAQFQPSDSSRRK